MITPTMQARKGKWSMWVMYTMQARYALLRVWDEFGIWESQVSWVHCEGKGYCTICTTWGEEITVRLWED